MYPPAEPSLDEDVLVTVEGFGVNVEVWKGGK
jgi:hypothetical protein